MKELIRRLFVNPLLAMEILGATFFITLLTLAMPLYVIQILNRYVSYGFHGTLITLTSGMLIAIVLQLGFRVIRTKMAVEVNQLPNDQLSKEILTIISKAKSEPLDHFSKPRVQQILNHVQTLQTSFDAQTLNTIIDAPFSLLFIGVTYLLSPILAGVAFIGILIGLVSGWITVKRTTKDSEIFIQQSTEHRSLNFSVVNAGETVRVFNAIPYLQFQWQIQLEKLSNLRKKMADMKELSQTITMSGSSITSVALYAVGASFVVQGDLTVGALIGANILAARAYQNSTKLTQVGFQLTRARQALEELNSFRQLPLESEKGSAIKPYQGQIEFQDVGFAYPNASAPIFESLSLTLPSNSVLVVTGENGTGKTTLAKILAGLLDPKRGNVLADEVNLKQLAMPWWRQQLIYMPQEPFFLNGPLIDNLRLINPEIDEAALNAVLTTVDLKPFLNKTPDGLDMIICDNGRNLPPGIRRRLSLARAMTTNGPVVILDEPTDALDETGMQAIYQLMNNFVKAGKTIIVFSNDPKIVRGATMILDLNVKPVPGIKTNSSVSTNRSNG